MRQLRLIAVLCACTWSLPLSAAGAQSSPRAPAKGASSQHAVDSQASLGGALTGAAKQEYEAGRILFGDGDYAGALVKFDRALEQSGDLRLLWNMAVCEKNLRHYVRVLQLLERYRRDSGDSLSWQQRTEVASVVDTVRTLISAVQLQVEPAGADVFVDDVPQGTTPLSEPLMVDLGTRKIRVSKAGYQDWVLTREFAGHSTVTITASLRALPKDAHLTVFADAAASIRIDGVVRSQGHFQGVLPAGDHHIEITAKDKVAFVRDLTLAVGESRTLHVGLESDSSGISPLVWIGAAVLVAGGAAAGVYVLTRSNSKPEATAGTLSPYVITVPN